MIKQPTLAAIRTIFANILPQAKVESFVRTSLGNMNWVYTINLNQPADKLILKVVYRKDREEQEILAKEARIIKLLNQRQIAYVPKLIYFDPSKELVPLIYLVESYLDGRPLIEQHEQISENSLKPIIIKVAEFISTIQRIKFKKITEFEKFRPEFSSFISYVKAYTDKYCQICLNSHKMSKELIRTSHDFILQQAGKIKDKKFVLNHGDISSHNILIKNKKYVGIIDFEATQTLTPEFDLVTFYHEFLWRYPKLWQLLLKEYVKSNQTPSNFKERLNIIMGYRSLRYLYIAVKNKIYQYLKGDIRRMEEVLDGSFLKSLEF